MRIAQCNDAFLPIIDGVGRVTYEYARIIGERGHESYVIAPMSEAGYRARYPFEILDFQSVRLPGPSRYKTGVATMDRHYMQRVESVKLDLIHAHSPGFSGLEAVRLADKRHIPLVGTFHTRYYQDILRMTHSEALAKVALKYIVDFYDRCDEVWAVSRFAQQELRSYGFKGHIEIVPHGVSGAQVEDADIRAARERYSLTDAPLLLYVGQIDWKKNLKKAIEAAALLKKRGVRFQLLLVGKGGSMTPAMELVKELGLSDCVRFTGHITDMQQLYGLYHNASLLFFPSDYDTAGLVVREAALAGVPSLVLRGGAPAECIVEGETGLLAENDEESLADAVEAALCDMERLRRIGAQAKERIPLSWDGVMNQVIDRYAMLIDMEKFQLKRKRGLFRKELDAMDKTLEKRKLSLMWRFLRQDMQNIYVYGYAPQKALAEDTEQHLLPRATPEEMGLRSMDLLRFFHVMDSDGEAGAQAMLVLRHGHVVAEGYWKPHKRKHPHLLFSMSKSIVSTAIGMLVDEGKLSVSERLVDIFKDKVLDAKEHPMREVTVWHLLTMSTGVRFDEVSTALGVDWVQEYLDSGLRFAPGSQFFYNSMNSYMLAAIVHRRAGMPVMEYLAPRLFAPLQIRSASWECCPQGIEKGGWGLSLTLDDAAKIGLLYLQQGVWIENGKEVRLLSREWIEAATSKQIETPNGECTDGYGYQIWMAPMEGAYLFNGAFGQHLLMMPEQDALVALFCGTSRLFAQGGLMMHATQCLMHAREEPLKPEPRALNMLRGALLGLTLENEQSIEDLAAMPMEPDWLAEHLQGRRYAFEDNVSGLFPLVLQSVHNNFSSGLAELRFDTDGAGRLLITCVEKDGENLLTVAADTFSDTMVTVRQETHAVSVYGLCGLTGTGAAVLRLYVYFLETPCTRVITMTFEGDTVQLVFDEAPNAKDAAVMLLELSGMTQWELYRALMPLLKREKLQQRLREFSVTRLTGKLVGGQQALPPGEVEALSSDAQHMQGA